MTAKFVLGVDAGGTKTTAIVATTNGEVWSCQETGPGNPIRAGKQVAFANIGDAIERAIGQADISPAEIGAAVVGMAGGGTEQMQAEAQEALARRASIESLCVVPDYKLVLPAAFPTGGVSVIAGTGSIVHGIHDDQETRVGGRGYLVDDGGSGFWIGCQALKGVVRSQDGRGPQTKLSAAICRSQSTTSPAEAISNIHASADRLAQIAAIAPTVVAMADTDELAGDILRQSADVLAEMIQAACNNIGFQGHDYPLAVAGSVLSKTPIVRDLLVARLAELDRAPMEIATVDAPVNGAIQIALHSRPTQ